MNKNGWGLTNELIFILIFIICLVIVVIGLKKLSLLENFNPNYHSNTDTNNGAVEKEYDYNSLEEKLRNSTIKYIEKEYNNQLGIDTLIIQSDTLREKGYLTDYSDENGKYCSGYCEVYINENDVIEYKPYVKCDDLYETEGYVERKDSNE